MVSPRQPVPPLEASVKREIASVARRAPGASKSWPAELALTLSREIESDGEDVPLAARVSAGKLLIETMDKLASSAPAGQVKDRLDELAEKRSKRVAKA